MRERLDGGDLPLVSCVLATRDRLPFLRQALKYFLRQSYPHRELIVVVDGERPPAQGLPVDPRIRYVYLDTPRSLGAKLNLGIEMAQGEVIQKLDDDDYYHPDFLAQTVGAWRRAVRRDSVIVGCGAFLVLVAATGHLTLSGPGWCAGGTLCFAKALWRRSPFRDVPRAVDWWFIQDHAPALVRLADPTLYMLVRHDHGHLWSTMHGRDVTQFFARRPRYPRPLRALLPPEDLAFYAGLARSRGGVR